MNIHDLSHARGWLDDSTDTEHPDDARAASTFSEALDLTASTWFTCWLCLELVPEEMTSRSGVCSSCAGDTFEARPTLSDALDLLLSFLNAEDSHDIGQTALRAVELFGLGRCGACDRFAPADEYDSRGWCFSCLDEGHATCSTCHESGRALNSENECGDCNGDRA